jgi:hypothetical protein
MPLVRRADGIPWRDASGTTSATVELRTPEPGTLCASGSMAPPQANNSFSDLDIHLILAPENALGFAPFDASAFGIREFQFTLDAIQPLPSGGMLVFLTTFTALQCEILESCLPAGAYLLTKHEPGTGMPEGVTVIHESGTTTASLLDFEPVYQLERLDPRRVAGILLTLSALDAAQDYSFCLRDLKFLGDGGEEVRACAASGG